MGMDLGDAKITITAKDEYSAAIANVQTRLEGMKDSLRKVGIAMTAVGVAGLKMVSDARQLNAQLGQTAITIGSTSQEMRGLALSTTDVTFSLQSVTSTFELLARAGVRNTEIMQKSAKAFDALADATDSSAEIVADLLLPAFKLFDEEIPTTSQELDKFTWMTKKTLVGLDDFGTLLTRMAPYMDTLNMSMDDAIATLAALGEQGIIGTAATLKLRTAITQAASSGEDLNTILGISQEEIAGFKQQMSDATGITAKYAAVANEQFGIMDKIKQKFSELTLKLGSVLKPLEPILAAMTALGPAMIFLSTQMGINALLWVKHTIAVVASKVALIAHAIASRGAATAMWLLNAAMSANPFILVATAISAVVGALLIFRNRVDSTTKQAVEDFQKLATEAQTAFYSISLAGKTMTEELMTNVVGNISAMFDAVILEINTRKDETITAMYAVFAGMHTVTEEEIGKTSAFLQQIFDEQTGIYKAYGEEIQQIYATAQSENRKVTEAENARINELILLTAQAGIKFTSAGTAQMEDLWRQMGENVGKITREMYASMLWQSEEATKQIVADASKDFEVYDKWLKEAAKLGLITGEIQRKMTIDARIETDVRIRVAEEETKRLKEELDKRYNEYASFWDRLKTLFWGYKLPELELTVSSQSGETARLPSLQYGGIVPGPIGKPVPILAHGGEAFGGISRAGMAVHREQHIHIHGDFMGDELSIRNLARKLQEVMREEERRTAFSGINTGYFYGGSHI